MPAAGQTVRGEVIEPRAGIAVGQGFVVLLADGREVARTMADDLGRFVIRAPAPGIYRLRSERIGFRVTTSQPIRLEAGQTIEYRLEIAAIPIRLEEIRVSGETRCRGRPEENQATATVWEEARKALAAVAWSQSQRQLAVTIRNYARALSPDLTIRSESSRTISGRSNRPYRASPASELARLGYVRRTLAGDYDFFAPDAEVLFSDHFLNGHCFRLLEGSGETAGLLGLAFDPVDRSLADISGTIWLHRETAELQFVEFRFVNTDLPGQSDLVGGRVDFVGLANGVWLVHRWYLRMPEFGVVSETHVPDIQQAISGRGSVRAGHRAILTGLQETGGELVDVRDARGRNIAGLPGGALTGSITDSTRGLPLIGAMVRLAGTARSTTTGPGGEFRLDEVRPGEYQLEFRHDDFPAWGTIRAPQRVSVRAGDTATVQLAVPPSERLFATLCPDHASPDSLRGAAGGVVRDAASGRPAAGVRVQLQWETFDVRGNREAVIRGQASGYEVVTDRDGYFLVCDLPSSEEIEPRAIDGPWQVRGPPFTVQPGELREIVLIIDRT